MCVCTVLVPLLAVMTGTGLVVCNWYSFYVLLWFLSEGTTLLYGSLTCTYFVLLSTCMSEGTHSVNMQEVFNIWIKNQAQDNLDLEIYGTLP